MRPWRRVLVVLAVSQLVAPVVVSALAGDFLESGATNEALITPAGYAFSLWGVITLLCATTSLAVWRFGLGPSWETSLLVDASVVFVGFSLWLAVAAQDWLWATVAVFAVMVGALAHIMLLLVRHRSDLSCPPWLATLATVTFGLYLGWSSIAVFANVAAALIDSGVSPDAVPWQLVVLVAAAGFAVLLTVTLRGTVGYAAGVLWALVAIAIGAAQRDSVLLAATAAVAAVIVAGATAWSRRVS
ncbi:hypothetical protein H7H73_20230 [Mycobacterium rufum]|uniref:Uncharacterized protein n=1 Tax=Mycolicibacterium rufum TaxID=318424 RepID=A0A9X2YE30_9MYCO|nr:hypothetical protein [Mycolicibacterium rufum]